MGRAMVPARWYDDFWFVCVALLGLVAASWLVRALWPLIFIGGALWLFWMRAAWLPKLKAQVAVWRAWWIRKLDRAPTYWPTPAQSEEHQSYRNDYEMLVAEPGRIPRGKLLLIAEVVDALQGWGDNPLAAPPTFRQQAFAQVGPAGLLGSSVGRWMAIGVGVLIIGMLGTIGVLWGQTKALERARDIACTEAELGGRTSREPCRDLGVVADELARATVAAEQAARARATDVGSGVREARETGGLNQRRARRDGEAAARVRRGRTDDLESNRNARAPNWDERLRDVTTPLQLFGPESDGAAAGSGAVGGVPGDGAGSSDVPDPGVAASTGGTDRPAVEPGREPGDEGSAPPVP